MRSMFIIALVLVACDDKGSRPTCEFNGSEFEIGEVFPAGDGCNSCSCTESGVQCTRQACFDGGIDGDPQSCAPSNGCPEGPSCNAICCGVGEKCVGGTCMCGGSPACGAGDACSAAGPIGGDSCGSICCGTSGPCPL